MLFFHCWDRCCVGQNGQLEKESRISVSLWYGVVGRWPKSGSSVASQGQCSLGDSCPYFHGDVHRYTQALWLADNTPHFQMLVISGVLAHPSEELGVSARAVKLHYFWGGRASVVFGNKRNCFPHCKRERKSNTLLSKERVQSCVCAYTSTYTYASTHTYALTHTWTYTSAHLHMFTYICIHACMHICTHMRVY